MGGTARDNHPTSRAVPVCPVCGQLLTEHAVVCAPERAVRDTPTETKVRRAPERRTR